MFIHPGGQQELNLAGSTTPEQLEIWRNKYSEKYNNRWGRAVREKVVKEVDTFGGKYEEPLIQNRQRLL